ncbi:MAG TPA: hypothetical protein VF940_24830 [Streptosporangiaceae bacterium]
MPSGWVGDLLQLDIHFLTDSGAGAERQVLVDHVGVGNALSCRVHEPGPLALTPART